MATDEEYLDSLLKSMTDNEQNRSMEEVMREVTKVPGEEETSYGLEDFFGDGSDINDDIMEMGDDILGMGDEALETSDDFSGINDDASQVAESTSEIGEENAPPESDEWKLDLDDILAQADAESGEDNTDSLFDMSDWENEEPSVDIPEPVNEEENLTDLSGMNAADPIDSIDSIDSIDMDLAEFDGLLKGADNKESVDDDILALLEGVDVTRMDEFDDADSEFSIFSESDLEKSANYGSDAGDYEENVKGKKKKEKKAKKEKDKKKSKIFGKKQDKEEAKIPEEDGEALQDGFNLDNLLGGAEDGSTDVKEKKKEKKAGFFSKVIDFLTEEDEEEEELAKTQADAGSAGEEGDKNIPEKGRKKKKAGKKGKKEKGKDKEELSEEELDAEEENKSKAKKKPKKEKKEKVPKEKVKGVKVLSTKQLLALIAFCATIIACVTVLGTFLPEYADKKNARVAFYEGDYDTVYKLLYDRQLNDSDSIIFNRVKAVLKLERKLQSYENHIALNREVEAVDALMQGVRCYYELTAVETYGAREELEALYQQICAILESRYGITPDEAVRINAYDDVSYTMKLNAVVNGTEFAIPGEEMPEEPMDAEPMRDLLPEEEELIRD